MKRFLTQLWKEEEGATMVEYGIMVALIAAVAIATVVTVGSYTDGAFTDIRDEMSANGVPGGTTP